VEIVENLSLSCNTCSAVTSYLTFIAQVERPQQNRSFK